jgi:hypothetical protein
MGCQGIDGRELINMEETMIILVNSTGLFF